MEEGQYSIIIRDNIDGEDVEISGNSYDNFINKIGLYLAGNLVANSKRLPSLELVNSKFYASRPVCLRSVFTKPSVRLYKVGKNKIYLRSRSLK